MRNRSVGAACNSTGNVLCRVTSSTTMTSRMVSAYSGQAGGDQERPSPDSSHTRRSPTSKTPQSPRRLHRARLVPRHVPPVGESAAMGRAAVFVRNPALVPRDVRRGQPEHSVPLETERATSSAARQGNSAVHPQTRRGSASASCE